MSGSFSSDRNLGSLHQSQLEEKVRKLNLDPTYVPPPCIQNSLSSNRSLGSFPPSQDREIKEIEEKLSRLDLAPLVPPPGIRYFVHKTASFVAKYGRELEVEIIAQNHSLPLFCFLKASDQYHDYYLLCVSEYQQASSQQKEQ